jgi:hypothetical protein
VTSGSGAASCPATGTRTGISISRYFPRCVEELSMLGVAEPSTHTAPSRWARTTATSRAW